MQDETFLTILLMGFNEINIMKIRKQIIDEQFYSGKAVLIGISVLHVLHCKHIQM